jgi:hypothetical protein
MTNEFIDTEYNQATKLHQDGWYYCADSGAWENHWVLLPLDQLDDDNNINP